MTGFEPGSSGIVGDRSANCATTTSQQRFFLLIQFQSSQPGHQLHSEKYFPLQSMWSLVQLLTIGYKILSLTKCAYSDYLILIRLENCRVFY